MKKYVDKIGLEIECMTKYGYPEDTPDEISEYWEHKEDGSVEPDGDDSDLYPREYASVPFENMAALNRETQRLYTESVGYVNSSCGLHIHVSLKEKGYYQRLANMDFYKHFLHTLELTPMYKLNSLLRSRMNGENTYAHSIDESELNRLVAQKGSRYKLLNWNAYRQHGTLEFRVFPAMRKAESVTQAVRYTTKAINTFLDSQRIKDLWKETREITTDEIKQEKEVITLSQIARGF